MDLGVAIGISVVFAAICLVIYYGLIRLVQNAATVRYAKDPVCDMIVDIATARLTSVYHGETVYFCAPGCKWAFDKDPERYLVRSLRRSTASERTDAGMN